MSLLMLKTKNLSWQDHTLNIEAMLAPLRSTLLMNKHKTLDTKFDQEKALYQRQRDACIKDFVVEKRLIERRRQKIINRKKEILQEIRSQSALDHAQEKAPKSPHSDTNKERSFSAPSDRRLRGESNHGEGIDGITSALPRLTLKPTSLFGGNPLRPRLFLETGNTSRNNATTTTIYPAGGVSPTPTLTKTPLSSKPTPTKAPMFESSKKLTTISNPSSRNTNIFITASTEKGSNKNARLLPSQQKRSPSGAYFSRPPKTPEVHQKQHQNAPPPNKTTTTTTTTTLLKEAPTTTSTTRGLSNHRGTTTNKRIPNVTFLGLLNNEVDDDDDSEYENGGITVEVKQKSVEDKVRDFLRDLEAFNSRPPTAVDENDDVQSVFSSVRSRDIYNKPPLVANRYNTLTLDKKLLEKAFDRYIEKKSHEDLLKAMKLAAKMKAHIRQARNTSLVPTMAAFKSSRTFLKILKRQQRKEKQSQAML